MLLDQQTPLLKTIQDTAFVLRRPTSADALLLVPAVSPVPTGIAPHATITSPDAAANGALAVLSGVARGKAAAVGDIRVVRLQR